MNEIKTPKVEPVRLRQFHHSREFVTGALCLTDIHLIFIEPTGAQETWVLHHHVSSMERLPLTTRGYPLIIETKTFQQLHLIIPRESDCLDVMATIKMFAQPQSYSQLFAYQYKPKHGEMVKRSSGWALYDSASEYHRMGVPNKYWKDTTINANFELCDTYSKHLYIPAAADVSTVRGSCKFRSKGRLPVLSLYYEPKQTALCRSSQPLAGITRRSAEDEQMIQAIVNANPNSEFIYVVDTRPKINAIANRATGKGYENLDHYSNVVYQFYNIHNIHVMRESLQKMVEAVCLPTQTISGFLAGLEASGWMKHIHLILETSLFIATALHDEGVSVLVHCSDGWDRTAQTCALASLLIDPYYRTLHGFMVLIEKEWLAFGHKFSARSGHLAGESRDVSPIFTQFLECVWQVMVQYPTAFQFNEHLLLSLHEHLHSCQFGTFLGNCEKERTEQKFSEQTHSFWGYVWVHLDNFMNPLYTTKTCQDMLIPTTDIPQLSFWHGLYCRYHPHEQASELKDEVLGSITQQNNCIVEHVKFLQQNLVALKESLARLEAEVQSSQAEERNVLANGTPELNFRLPGSGNRARQDLKSSRTDSSGALSPPPPPPATSTVSATPSQDASLNSQQVHAHTNSHSDLHTTSDPSSLLQSSLESSITSDSSMSIGGTSRVCLRSQEREVVHFSSIKNGSTKTDHHTSKTDQESETSVSAQSDWVNSSSDYANSTVHGAGKSNKAGSSLGSCHLTMDPSAVNSVSTSMDNSLHTPTDSSLHTSADSSLHTSADNSIHTSADNSLQCRPLSPASRLSPESYTFFKECLNHVPEMNLPWQSMRSVWQCSCGTAFSFSARKYHCSYCGSVVCGVCGGNQAPLPFHATPKPHRVCRTCFKLMRSRIEDLEQQLST